MISPELLQQIWHVKIILASFVFGLATLVILEIAYFATLIATAPPRGGGDSPFTRKRRAHNH